MRKFPNKNLLRVEIHPDMCSSKKVDVLYFIFEVGATTIVNGSNSQEMLVHLQGFIGCDATEPINEDGKPTIHFSDGRYIYWTGGDINYRTSCQAAWTEYYRNKDNCLTTKSIPALCPIPQKKSGRKLSPVM